MQDFDPVLGREGYWGHRVADSGVVESYSQENSHPAEDNCPGSYFFLGHFGSHTHLYSYLDPSRDYSCHYVEIVMIRDEGGLLVDQAQEDLELYRWIASIMFIN